MSKYSSAREAIDLVVNNGEDLGLDREEMLSALIISALADYQEHVGRDETRVLLTYELDNLGGKLDMVNLRAR
jgi:hypothetical protein